MDFTSSYRGEDRNNDHEVQAELCSLQVRLTQTYNSKAYKILDRMATQLGKTQQQQNFIWSVFIKEADWAYPMDNKPLSTLRKVLLLLICLAYLCCSGQLYPANGWTGEVHSSSTWILQQRMRMRIFFMLWCLCAHQMSHASHT